MSTVSLNQQQQQQLGMMSSTAFNPYPTVLMTTAPITTQHQQVNPDFTVQWTPLKTATLCQSKVAILTGGNKIMGSLVVTYFM